MDNRNTIPGQYSTIQQGEANRIVDQNLVGIATGNQAGYQEARFTGGSNLVNNGAYQENRYTNVSAGGPVVHTNANYVEPQRYTEQTQVVRAAGVAPREEVLVRSGGEVARP